AAVAASVPAVAPAAADPLAILTQGAVTSAPVVHEPQPRPQLPPPAKAPETLPQPAVMRPLVIAIDAAHGGQDPGSRGPSGTREKDVALAIAKELARQVDATPGMKAYLTRDSD